MSSTISMQDITIYVVDDDRDIRENTTDLLSIQYPRIEAFDSPKAVLAKLKLHAPVVILTDLRMPGGDGLEFAKSVRELDADLPVILITGRFHGVTRTLLKDTSAIALLEKPMRGDLLLETVERALKQIRRT